MTESNKKQYFSDIRVINYLLQGIPNDIYNLVDACKDAKTTWERIKRLMHGSDKTEQVRHSRLMDEFDKFVAMEGESLTSVYENLTTLVNVMDSNNVRPLPISINTKFLNSLQPEWSKYVTMTRQSQNLYNNDFDHLYEALSQYEPHVNASKAKKVARNNDPLALVAHSNTHSSYSHVSSSYSNTPQPYYVTHPSSVIDHEEDYQGELQGDTQEDKITTAMMLLARAITQKFSTPTNNRLRTSSNPRNQAVIQDGRADIESKNVGYARNSHYACDCPKLKVRATRYFRKHMLLAMKDEVGGTLNGEENDFMLDNAYGDDTLEELTAAVIMMAHIQPTNDKGNAEPKYDVDVVNEVNASQINRIIGMSSKSVHEHKNHTKLNTVNTSDDDQIDSNIIFDDSYVENNSGTDEHDSNAHGQSFDIQLLINNVQKEAKNQQTINNELKKQKTLLQKELETCKERVKTLEKKPIHFSKYQEACEELEREIPGLGYQNLERLKKAIASQPKMYDGERIQSTKLKIDSPDSEETLEDAKEKIPIEQTYFSTPSTSSVSSESDLRLKKMPNESKLLQLFVKLDNAIGALQTNIDETLLKDRNQRVTSSSSVRRPESKDTKLKKRVLPNTKSKKTSTNVKNLSSSVSVVSNKRETLNSTICQSNASVLKAKTLNVVNDDLNLVCVSCGKDVFLIPHDKCVAIYALSADSRVKRALFKSLVAAKSKNLGASFVVAKSRFSVAKTPKATNKVSSASSLSPESSQSYLAITWKKIQQVGSGKNGLKTNHVSIGHQE
ncbi:hypothetical protein Tco_0300037 [Tanacetum coccineum]